MASKTPLFKTHKSTNRKTGKPQWSWKLRSRNGEVIAAGRGLDKEPKEKYLNMLAHNFAVAVYVKPKVKKQIGWTL